jgi:cytochrome P450
MTAIDRLPGPRRLPVLGNLLQLRVPRLHLQLEDWARTYGPLFRMRIGAQEIVVVSSAEDIAAILRARPDHWSRPANLSAMARDDGFVGLFAAEGDAWRRQRRLVMGAFDPAHLRNYMPHLVRVTRRLRNRWSAFARAGNYLPLQRELMRYSFDASAGLAYGMDINTLEDRTTDLHEHLGSVFPMLFHRLNIPFPYWKYLRLPSDRAYDRHLAQIHRIIGRIVEQGRERLRLHPERRAEPTDLLEAMLAAADEDGSALNESDISANVFTMLLASQDTTANTIAWTLYLLRQHPEAWQRLIDEARAVLKDGPVADRVDQVRQLRYAEACTNEAMRLKPVAPLIFLDALRDTAIRQLHIPKGTRVFLVMRYSATDAAVVESPREFRPERWLGGDIGAASPKRVSMPFGAGPRLCPGRYLAMIEIGLVLGMVARGFELLDVATPDGSPPEECLAFTMHPGGLRMRLAEVPGPA